MMSPYEIIRSRRLTEKSRVLEQLHQAKSNRSLARCQTPKVVFEVHPDANKAQIARAVEAIYAEKKIKVVRVNTIFVKPKWRTVRGFSGQTAGFKKAIVTLRSGDQIEALV